jgi:hypothetical protein
MEDGTSKIYGNISLKLDVILHEGVEMIRMAQDSYEWQDVMNRVKDFCFQKMWGSSWPRELL